MAQDITTRDAPRPGRPVGPALLLLAVCVAFVAAPAAGAPRRFRVDGARSRVDVTVGKAGLFRFAGHAHVVRAPVARGEVIADPEALAVSTVWLGFDTAEIRVLSSEGPADEIPEVQEKMASPSVLDVVRFPEVRFESRRVSGRAAEKPGDFELQVLGELTLHGATRPVTAKLRAELRADLLVVKGTLRFKQSDFGIHPVSVAGVVKVKDELVLDVEVVALAGRE
jgi:polyisoprenoid-binding protein YceI